MSILDPFSEVKSTVLGAAVLTLGAALVLTGGYAAWGHFVTIPRAEARADMAEEKANAAIANTHTCIAANAGLTNSIDHCNGSIDELKTAAAANQKQLDPILKQLGLIGKDVKTQLASYRPDPKKSDCENAKAELQLFKADRQKP